MKLGVVGSIQVVVLGPGALCCDAQSGNSQALLLYRFRTAS